MGISGVFNVFSESKKPRSYKDRVGLDSSHSINVAHQFVCCGLCFPIFAFVFNPTLTHTGGYGTLTTSDGVV